MNRDDHLSFEKIKVIRDDCTIRVFDNDMEQAARKLYRKVLQAGTLRELKLRERCPKRSDRLKAKRLRSKSNRLRTQARRQATAAKDTRR